MIVDTSALAAILFQEAEAAQFTTLLATSVSKTISAGNWLELTVVLARHGRPDLIGPAERLCRKLAITISAVSVEQTDRARDAYLRYGKGSPHPAKLNFGDCFAYALSKESGEPLLFKGDDFSQTDVHPAIRA